MLINIHTHQQAVTEFALQNLFNNFEEAKPDYTYSMGLHPWYLNENTWQDEFALLKTNSIKSKVLAIGECGLDKVCTTNFKLQVEVFLAQLQWANQINKPIIIHCVRAYEEVFLALKNADNKVPIIFHGFNKKLDLANKIVEQGYYLSFGKSLQHSQFQEVLSKISLNHIFLETDDDAIAISDMYALAAGILKIDINTLSLQIQKNAATVFGAAITTL